MGDAVVTAIKWQKVPTGHSNAQVMLSSPIKKGGGGVCGTCMDARGIPDVIKADSYLSATSVSVPFAPGNERFRIYSIRTPASFTTLPHFSNSAFNATENWAGVSPIGSAPWAASLSFNPSCFRISPISTNSL